MKIALFDMDNSLADFSSKLLNDLELLRSPEEVPIDELSLWNHENIPHIQNRMFIIKSQPNWWLNLPVIKIGMDALEAIKSIGYEVQILTKGPKGHPCAWKEKVEWCQRHLGNIDVHICADKSKFSADIFYDDYPPYMINWIEKNPKGLGIMPVNKYNKDFTHPGVFRYDGNTDELRKIVESL